MEIKDLDRQIKANELGSLYFFCGEEQFLMDSKLRAMKKRLIAPDFEEFNYVRLDGKKISSADIQREILAVPVMSDKKMVVVTDSGIFSNQKSRGFGEAIRLIEDLPEYICLVFCEKEFEKKKEKNLEIFKNKGQVVRFNFQPPVQLERWLEELFEKQGKSILAKDVAYIVELAGQSMARLYSEYQKLLGFVGDRTKITAEDIEAVVSKSTETRIFDMIDNLASGKKKGVFEELAALKTSGESPSTVLTIISSRIGELLMVKQLSQDKLGTDKIAGYFDPPRPVFVINKLLTQSKKFTEDYLLKMTLLGPEYTAKVRSGLLDSWLAVEMYAAKLLDR